MKKQITKVIKNPFFSGSMLMVVGINAISALNYIYHLIMIRFLRPEEYGILATIFSLIGLLGIVPASLGLVITKFISQSKDDKEISNEISYLNDKFPYIALPTLAIVILASPLLSRFLNIDNWTFIIMAGIVFIFSLPTILNWAALQGLLRFKKFVLNNFVANISKLLFGVGLVLLGYGVSGALIGLILSSVISWAYSKYLIRDQFIKNVKATPNIKPMISYSIPIFVQALSFTSLYSTDIVLVKHFFTPYQSGIYSAISVFARIIYFAVTPVINVMFPMVSKHQARQENYKHLFYYSFIIGAAISAVGLLILYFLPQISILFLGNSYVDSKNLLLWMGIAVALFTLSSIMINYYLSLGKVNTVIFPALVAVLQIIGIVIYHSTLLSVIMVSLAVNSLLLISLFIYSVYAI